MPTSKGFLIRGTLRPSMGSTTGGVRNFSAATRSAGRPIPATKPMNRIPASMTMKRNLGMR